jgi:hypothetical protein
VYRQIRNMPRLLFSGLALIATGLLFACGMFLFKWGPCGPSSIWGLVFIFAAMTCGAVGSLLIVAGLLRKLAGRSRLKTAS